jgi:hypothetical protein
MTKSRRISHSFRGLLMTIRFAGFCPLPHRAVGVALAVLWINVHVSIAQPPSPKPQVIKLTVSPAAAPRGALRVRLLPEYLDRTPGNRATLYYRAMVISRQTPADALAAFEKDRERWQEVPWDKLPRAEVRKRLATYTTTLKELHAGAWREDCDWGIRLRELKGMEPIMLLLPDVQETRNFARVLSLKCRLELAEGRLADAQKTLQTMLQLGRDVGETPTLINGLVGVAIVSIAAGELQQYVQHPQAGSLYWALTALPRPMIDFREAAEQERSFPLQLMPILREMDKPFSPERWRDELVAAIRDFGQIQAMTDTGPGGPRLSETQAQLALTAMLLRGYPMAKRALIEQGRDRKEIEAMPVAQVVALHLLDSYHYAWGEVFKCFYLPYPQAAAEYEKVERLLKEERILAPAAVSKEVIPLAGLLLPAVGACLQAQVRADRAIDELRCIEALRMYVASHGRWPKSLSEIKDVPVPNDPATGQAFGYRLEGETAVLESQPMTRGDGQGGGRTVVTPLRRIELTLRQK